MPQNRNTQKDNQTKQQRGKEEYEEKERKRNSAHLHWPMKGIQWLTISSQENITDIGTLGKISKIFMIVEMKNLSLANSGLGCIIGVCVCEWQSSSH